MSTDHIMARRLTNREWFDIKDRLCRRSSSIKRHRSSNYAHTYILNTTTYYKKTPLYYAWKNEHMDVMKYLICHGADVSCNDKDGLTLLHYASSKGYIDLMQLLIKHGANVNMKDAAGWTPLHIASFRNNIDVIRILIEHGAYINAMNISGRTPLSWATPNSEAIKLLS